MPSPVIIQSGSQLMHSRLQVVHRQRCIRMKGHLGLVFLSLAGPNGRWDDSCWWLLPAVLLEVTRLEIPYGGTLGGALSLESILDLNDNLLSQGYPQMGL